MSDNETAGAARLPLLAPEELNREQKDVYDRIDSTMLPWAKKSGFKAVDAAGRLLGPFNAMLYNPELGSAQLNLLATEQDSTGLDARVREVVILTVGAAFESPYEVYAHRAVGEKSGLSPETVAALASGTEPEQLTPDERVTFHFVRELVGTHRVSEPTFAAAQKAFGHKCLVDMVHLVGVYLGVAAMLNAFAVPVPADQG